MKMIGLTLVAFGLAYSIVADDAFVYWSDGVGIYSAPVDGGTGSLLATGTIGRMALDEEGALYWVDANSYISTGSVHRMQNRVDAVIASGQHENGGLAVDANYAYFTCGLAGATDPAIRRVPKKGGSVETLVTTFATYLRVDSAYVYYVDFAAQVWALSKSTGVQRRLTPGGGWTRGEFDVNDFKVWWLWVGVPADDGLFRANSDGTGLTAIDTAPDSSWYGPRVDDTAVYYFHNGALLRRLK